MIFKQIDALASVMDNGDRAARRRWLGNALLMLAGDFGVVYSQILALQQQRANEPYTRELFLFVLAILFWLVTARRLWDRTDTALAQGAKVRSDRIVERLSRLPLQRFEALGRGTIMTRLTSDAQQIADAAQPLIGVPTSLIRLGIGAVYAFSISTSAACVAVMAMLLMGLVIATQMTEMQASLGRLADDEVLTYDLLRGHVNGAAQLKLHAPRAEAIGRAFNEVSSRMRALRISIFARFFERRHAATAALYGVLGINVFLLPLVMTVENETLREINLILVWVVFSVAGVLYALPQLESAADALERLHDLDALLAEDGLEPAIDPAAAQDRFRGLQTLTARGLRFSYTENLEPSGFTVGPIDLSFRRGEVVFITGRNGSGKSTFLKMLTGLYPPAAGQLWADDTLIDQHNMAQYRQLFGTIFTDHYLFTRVFGVAAGDEERAKALLEEMQIAHKTSIVGGRVTNRDLSTGQKKRLAMVLTLLQDRPILVFDEWAADQDPEFRALYYRKILPSLGAAGKLVLAVSHDDQYFDCADRVINFHNGRIQANTGREP